MSQLPVPLFERQRLELSGGGISFVGLLSGDRFDSGASGLPTPFPRQRLELSSGGISVVGLPSGDRIDSRASGLPTPFPRQRLELSGGGISVKLSVWLVLSGGGISFVGLLSGDRFDQELQASLPLSRANASNFPVVAYPSSACCREPALIQELQASLPLSRANASNFPHKSQQRLITFCRATTWWSASSWKPLIPCRQKKAMKHASVTFRDKTARHPVQLRRERPSVALLESSNHVVVSVKLETSHPVQAKESNEARQCHVQGQTARHPVQLRRERPSVALLEST